MVDLTKLVGKLGKLPGLPLGTDVGSDLSEGGDFGSNPGNLRMWTYRPVTLRTPAPLVVALHGCTQSAAAYNAGCGWATLADEFGFSLLLPEQQRSNNPNGCFNWFSPDDTQRNRGEALSIRQMVGNLVEAGVAASDRIYITGLSAGGAMATAMLATYPELFAGGAIIGGLPYGCATNVTQALNEMRQGPKQTDCQLGDLVRKASDHDGRWPRISIWHGTADHVVVPANGNAIVRQWLDVNALRDLPALDTVDGQQRRTWRDASGRPCIEEYAIANMGHGVPLDLHGDTIPHGQAGPFFLDAGIASSLHIARFFDLADAARAPAKDARAKTEAGGGRGAADAPRHAPSSTVTAYVQDVIAKALKSAGLTR